MTDAKPKTLSVPDAGRLYFGLSRGASYEAARRGELPVIRMGDFCGCRWSLWSNAHHAAPRSTAPGPV